MKLVWCPDTASKAYIDAVGALAAAAHADDPGRLAPAAPEVAELVAAMAGGWNARLIVDAPDAAADPSSPDASSSPATSLALAAAARRTGARYARVGINRDDDPPSSSAEAAMARLDGVDLLVLDARRRDAATVLRAARPGPRGMVVVRHGGGVATRRRGAGSTTTLTAPPPPSWVMAPGTRVVRAAHLPIGAGGVEVLHVGVGKGPSLPARRTPANAARGRWIRHVNHRTGEEHVFRRQ